MMLFSAISVYKTFLATIDVTANHCSFDLSRLIPSGWYNRALAFCIAALRMHMHVK